MLLQYAYADYSTDIWSLGSIFAALLYRKLIYFASPVETSLDQLLLIAQVLVKYSWLFVSLVSQSCLELLAMEI